MKCFHANHLSESNNSFKLFYISSPREQTYTIRIYQKCRIKDWKVKVKIIGIDVLCLYICVMANSWSCFDMLLKSNAYMWYNLPCNYSIILSLCLQDRYWFSHDFPPLPANIWGFYPFCAVFHLNFWERPWHLYIFFTSPDA